MSIFHLAAWCGAILGIALGWERGGVAATVVGAMAGGAGGLLVLLAGFGAMVLLERRRVRRRLASRFGRYWRRDRQVAWRDVKVRWSGGAFVRGSVVHREYFGGFLDLGCGFPARLPCVDGAGGLDPDPPPVGAECEARVLEFSDFEREIVLTRFPRRWLVFGGVRVGYLPAGEAPDSWGATIYTGLSIPAHREFANRLARDGRIECELAGDDGSVRVVITPRRPIGITITPTGLSA